jgi:hypothetical protein
LANLAEPGYSRYKIHSRQILLTALFLGVLSGLAQAQKTTNPTWKFSGDMRLRHEVDTNRPGDRPARQRSRLRLRLKAVGDLSPELQFGTRFRTGNHSNPVSANYSFASSPAQNEAFDVVLDQAYLLYRPQGSGFSLGVGKLQPLPSRSALAKMVIDTDYSPAGVRLAWSDENWNLAAGTYILDRTASSAGARAQIAQGGYTWTPAERTTVSAELTYTQIDLLTPLAQSEALAQNASNRTVDRDGDGHPDAFASDFQILQPGVSVKTSLGELPVRFDAHYLWNLGAPSGSNEGLGALLQLGALKEPGDFEGYYRYHRLEDDAVFTPIAQDDFPLMSGFEGQAVGVRYRAAKNTTLHGWVLRAKPLDSGQTRYRYRMDCQLRW